MKKAKKEELFATFRVWMRINKPEQTLAFIRKWAKHQTYKKTAINIAKTAMKAHKEEIRAMCS